MPDSPSNNPNNQNRPIVAQASVGAKVEKSNFDKVVDGIWAFLSAPCTRESGCKGNNNPIGPK